MGMTTYEQRESLGESQVWKVDNDHIACAMRVQGHDAWIVEATFHVASSLGVQLVALKVSPISLLPSPPVAALSTEVIRGVRFGDLYQRIREFLPHASALGIHVDADPAALQGTKRPGRRGTPDSEYVWDAARYAELVRTTRSPTQALADELHISQSTARDRIHEARSRDLLTPTKQGVKGGTLTKKAIRLLSELGPGR